MDRTRHILLLVAAALLLITTVAYAAASWADVSGPTWNGADWVLTATATYTGGHKTTCISGTFPPAGAYGPLVCADPSPDGGAITCTIPGASVANATDDVSWQLTGYTGNESCLGNDVAGPSGAFAPNGTGPNAVTLAGFRAARESAFQSGILLPGGFAFLAAIAIAFALTQRRKQPRTPGL